MNDRLDRRLAIVLGPPPVRRQAALIAADVASITDASAGQWVYKRLAADRPDFDAARQYADQLRRMIQGITFDLKEHPNEAPIETLKWMGIAAAAAIAILLMLNVYFVWSTGTQLEGRLVALRQAGDPIQLADLAREPIPPSKTQTYFSTVLSTTSMPSKKNCWRSTPGEGMRQEQ